MILNDILTYCEPNEDGTNNQIFISVRDAITRQKCHAEFLGYSYRDSQEALEDFIALHWAVLKSD